MTARPRDSRDEGSFSVDTIAAVRHALAAAALREEAADAELPAALSDMCDEARTRGLPAERMVIALKQAWRTTHCPTLVGPADWEAVYRGALTDSLELYFHEGAG